MSEKTLRTSVPPPPKPGDPEVENFFKDLAGEDLSPVTLAGYRRDIEQFASWYRSQNTRPLSVGALSTLDLQSYRAQMVNVEGKKPATVNRRLEALKRLCRWAHEKGIHSEEIARAVKPVRVMKRLAPAGLERAEINALLRAAATSPRGQGKRNYAIVQSFLQAGLRLSDAAGLRVSDVELKAKSGWLRVRYGKGGKERRVPANASARAAIRNYIEKRREPRPESPLFASQRGGALTPRAIETILSETARRAGLEKGRVTALRLRHTFALTFAKDHPGALERLAQILGHESLDTTAIYAQPSREDLALDLEKSSLNVYG